MKSVEFASRRGCQSWWQVCVSQAAFADDFLQLCYAFFFYCPGHGLCFTLCCSCILYPGWKLTLNVWALCLTTGRAEDVIKDHLKLFFSRQIASCRPEEVLIAFDFCCHLAMRVRNLACVVADFLLLCTNSSSSCQKLMICMSCLRGINFA